MTESTDPEERQARKLQAMSHLALQHSNRTSSPLLRLPAEIRNKIYKLVFSDWRIYLDYGFCRRTKTSRIFARLLSVNGQTETTVEGSEYVPQISTVCRQVYIETRNMLVSLSEFAVGDIWDAPTRRFEKMGAEQKNLIEDLRILSGRSRTSSRWDWGFYEVVLDAFFELAPNLQMFKKLKRVTVVWEEPSDWECMQEWEMLREEVLEALRIIFRDTEVDVLRSGGTSMAGK